MRGIKPPFFMSDDSYDFYDDDWYDGAATMTLRGRRENLEKIYNTPSEDDRNV